MLLGWGTKMLTAVLYFLNFWANKLKDTYIGISDKAGVKMSYIKVEFARKRA